MGGWSPMNFSPLPGGAKADPQDEHDILYPGIDKPVLPGVVFQASAELAAREVPGALIPRENRFLFIEDPFRDIPVQAAQVVIDG